MPSQPSVGQIDFEAVRCLDGSLAHKLKAYVQFHWQHQRDVALLYQDLIGRLSLGGAGKNALALGDQLPTFVLPDTKGRLVCSNDLLAKGPIIVSFNRGSWCPFCRLELLALAEIHPEIQALGGEIVSVIPEKGEPAAKLKNGYKLPFPVLSDIDNGYALANGLMISCGAELHSALQERDIDLVALQGNSGLFMPITATYVVAPNGIVLDAFVDLDFRQRMPTERAIAAFKSL